LRDECGPSLCNSTIKPFVTPLGRAPLVIESCSMVRYSGPIHGHNFLYSSVMMPLGPGDFLEAMLDSAFVSSASERGCSREAIISDESLVLRPSKAHCCSFGVKRCLPPSVYRGLATNRALPVTVHLTVHIV
jgi:hypothetical protein